jgi:hypothetical protein
MTTLLILLYILLGVIFLAKEIKGGELTNDTLFNNVLTIVFSIFVFGGLILVVEYFNEPEDKKEPWEYSDDIIY